jgi:hypothetical protein
MKKASDKEPLHTLNGSPPNLHRQHKQLSCQIVIMNQIYGITIQQQQL